MGEPILTLKLSEARSKLTQLDRLLKPGQSLQVNKRGKAYARIELLGNIDPYEKTLELIDALPESEDELIPVAQHFKSILYGKKKKNT